MMEEYRLPAHIVKEEGLWFDTKTNRFLKKRELEIIQRAFLMGERQPNKQQLKYLQHLIQDKTCAQIAIDMKRSPRTIDGYRDELLQKFNVRSRLGIILFAIKNKLIEI